MTGFDVTSPGQYLDGLPEEQFAAMRARKGLVWHPYDDSGGSTPVPARGGFWAVTRHADVRAVGRAADTFSSGIGHTNLWDLEADALEARRSIIDTDPPDHTRLRRVVSSTFTPKAVRAWEATTRRITGQLLDRFIERGGGDWVELVAAPLPINVIVSILGVPTEDADHLVRLSTHLVESTTDSQSLDADAFGNTTPLRLLPFGSPASHALFEYGERIGAERRRSPADDLVTALVEAEIDGDRLTDAEFRNLFHVLVFAGNETTRTALTHGAMALANNADQWDLVLDHPDLIGTATEEILRWATPVLHMRRTAAHDTELAGTPIRAGDKVVMWYASSNFDDAVFDDPSRFDVSRSPNPHQSFGGGGPHFCLGAFLARMEIAVVLEEMAARRLTLRQTGAARPVASNFVRGILEVEMVPID